MRFVYRLEPSLPRLAWGARMRRQAGVVEVVHGPWVETRAGCFFEGAWDGPFEADALDEAVVLVGSGGRLVDGSLRFAATSHMLERLQSIEIGDHLYVANSLALLLVMADEALDLGHAHYFFDYLQHYRAGIGGPDKRLRLASGRTLAMHYCGNLVVRPDLSRRWTAKTAGEPPGDYAAYADWLLATLARVVENARHPARRQPFRPVVTLSQGYDSTAAAALASRVGCREAVTFRQSMGRGGRYVDDSGTLIGGRLGLEVTEYDRRDFQSLAGLPDAEFYVNPFATTDKAMAVMAGQFAGALVITGRHGENLWGTGAESGLPQFREPTATLMSGANLVDYRLRTGFLHLPLPACGALHAPAIRRITDAPEMRPWSVGGRYDRPIARRIAEEAGVPRHLFGQEKKGGNISGGVASLAPASRQDFLGFRDRIARAGHRLPRGSDTLARRAGRRLLRRHPGLWRTACAWLGDRLHPHWGSPDLYLFHWGVARTLERYRPARWRDPTAASGRPHGERA